MAVRTGHLHAAFHRPDTRIYRVVQGSVWLLILLSIAFLVAEALLPDDSPTLPLLHQIDRFVLAIFAIEIVLRVGSYHPPALEVFKRPPLGTLRTHLQSRLAFMLRPLVLVDILAVLALFPELRGLRALRLLRLLRTIRVFRYRNPFALVMQALEENGLLFSFAFSVLGTATILGGMSMYLVEVKLNPGINNVLDGLWWALVTITTVGFGDITPVTSLGRIVGGVLMISGMFTLALFAGIVGSSLVRGMLSFREEQFRMSGYVNHVVVCGFDESSDLLLEALIKELDLAVTRVVFFGDHERPRELPPEFLWVQGDQTKESELDKVRLSSAEAVIVTGARDMRPQAADARTILTTFTIRSYMRKSKKIRHRRQPLYLVAEILDSENVGHCLAAGANEVIETRKIGYSMIAHALGHHGTANLMSRVLMSGAHSVYIGKIPGPLSEPVSFRELMQGMKLSERGGLVIGVKTPEGKEVLNPARNWKIRAGTTLIYLAEKELLEAPE